MSVQHKLSESETKNNDVVLDHIQLSRGSWTGQFVDMPIANSLDVKCVLTGKIGAKRPPTVCTVGPAVVTHLKTNCLRILENLTKKISLCYEVSKGHARYRPMAIFYFYFSKNFFTIWEKIIKHSRVQQFSKIVHATSGDIYTSLFTIGVSRKNCIHEIFHCIVYL